MSLGLTLEKNCTVVLKYIHVFLVAPVPISCHSVITIRSSCHQTVLTATNLNVFCSFHQILQERRVARSRHRHANTLCTWLEGQIHHARDSQLAWQRETKYKRVDFKPDMPSNATICLDACHNTVSPVSHGSARGLLKRRNLLAVAMFYVTCPMPSSSLTVYIEAVSRKCNWHTRLHNLARSFPQTYEGRRPSAGTEDCRHTDSDVWTWL